MFHTAKGWLLKYRYLLAATVLVIGSAGIFLSVRTWLAGASPTQRPAENSNTITGQGGRSEMASSSQHVPIRLAAGQAQPQATPAAARVPGVPLTAAEIQAILRRLPELVVEPGDQLEFKLAQDPIPPPRSGETVPEVFPPPQQPGPPVAVQPGPLEVLRFSPEGEIPLAPFISVTFNQPMAPLATLHDLAAREVPVIVEPAIPGAWRWLGTRTLTFQYDSELIDRLPKATQYQVTVPAGTRSATGGVLAEAVSWSFSTPPPQVVLSYPDANTPQPADPLFFIAFDQRIDPLAVLGTIQAQAGRQPLELLLADETVIQADERVSALIENTPDGRWLALRAAKPLPLDATVSVVVGPGTPSAEGPLVTASAYTYSFYTYAPLRILEHRCAWSSSGPCEPLTPFMIRFNNPLDPAAFEDGLLRVEPALPGLSTNLYGDTLEIKGATQGRTTYSVTVDAGIRDIFGQELGKDARLTFQVGPARPLLQGPQGVFVTVDPTSRKPAFSVYTINLPRVDVKMYSVQPADWPAFNETLRQGWMTDRPLKLPGRLAFDRSIAVDGESDRLTEVQIDLSPALDGQYGHLIVVVTPPKGAFDDPNEWRWRAVQAWVQVTQIGLDAYFDQDDLTVWATALQDGAPLPGLEIQAGRTGAATDGQGLARLPIPAGAAYLVARQGEDQAMLPRSTSPWGDETWQGQPVRDTLAWYVFDDRQMYRPGEEVHVKGWLRRIGGGPTGDVSLVGGEVSRVSYQVIDPQGNDLGGGEVEVNALGGFDFAFTLPGKTNLGYAILNLNAQGGQGNLEGTSHSHQFQIQEFRRPEFEVTVNSETPAPYFAREYAVLAAEAKYYAGGPLPDAEINWLVTSTPGSYSPPNWPDFTFGIWTPWWWGRGQALVEDFFSPNRADGKTETFSGRTDAAGLHYLRLDFGEEDPPQPLSVQAQATVTDVNRQAWAGTTSLLVHPAELYVGLRSAAYFVERGAPLKVDFIVTDLDGNPVASRLVEVRAARLEWKYSKNEWREEEVEVQTCQQTSGLEPLTCTFETPLGGSYKISATVQDEQGRVNLSQLTRWVSGGQLPPARVVEQEQVTLIPDRETYQPGDTAQILVQSPFSPAEGLLTVSRSGMLYSERFRVEQGTITLQVPVMAEHIPNLHIQVDLVGSAPRSSDQGEALPAAPRRPAYASGALELKIPPAQRTLRLEVTPAEKELEPGGSTMLDLFVQDASGAPAAGAELAVAVVDEAVLALSNYQLLDPLAIFYGGRPAGLTSLYGRASILLADPQTLAQATTTSQDMGRAMEGTEALFFAAPAAEAPAAAESKAGAPAPAIRLRSDFNPLAAFAPAVRTDAAGRASLTVKLPDNLTRYRVMVVVVDSSGRQFGMAETNLVARLPLMVRPSAPRFLNFGDRFELPVVVQNQTEARLTVDVIAQVTNLELTGDAGLRVTVPARQRVEVRFPAAAGLAGTARIQVAAVAGDYTDAATVELPVYTPATSEAFAVYGVVDEGAVIQPLAAPTGVFPQYGGLEISTSSTALHALTDAVLYLVAYPFECSEQIASRILAVAALRDVLAAFSAEGLPPAVELEAAVQRDILRLQGMQNADGGFPYWRRGADSIPFNTIHAAHALQAARQKGFSVPEEMLGSIKEHLRQIERYYPAWYGKRLRQTLSAYALYVRDRMGDSDPAKGLHLLQEAGVEGMSLDGLGWLWPVLQDAPGAQAELEAIRRHVNNRAVETPGAANFTTEYDDQNYLLLGSNRRTDAILLQALIGDDPKHDLIPKLVNGLLAQRSRGRWANTQENVFVLLALDSYFQAFEAQTPDFVARIWLGEAYAGEHAYRGYNAERHETSIPMSYLVGPGAAGGTQDLTLSKEGTGRLYYRLGLRYAPDDLELEALDMGFAVQRRYEAVDDPADVYQDEQGAWHIKAGAKVRVLLTLAADNRRYHVALVDPLPAGLEIVNPGLAVSERIPQDPGSPDFRYGWWWWGPWYEHQNLRDERAEAFTSLLWDGVYEYAYVARATTPGRFVVPPSRAEEMYSPEVFGRSASAIVIVE